MKKYIVPSLLAAGFLTNPTQGSAIVGQTDDGRDDNPLVQKLQLNHLFTLAGHTSHSSHASHSSHYSHSSSAGGGTSAPPVYNPPASRVYTAPLPLVTLPGNSGKFNDIVRQVEIALTSYGYYSGAIDGVIGPDARNALKRFQEDYSLKITGTVTPEVLTALNITAK